MSYPASSEVAQCLHIKLDCHSKCSPWNAPRACGMAFLKLKLGTPRPVRRCGLVKLPVELLLLIGRQVRRTDLQNLRLVCKLLDDIFAPVVLSNIRLEHASSYLRPRHRSLRDLTRRNESLAFVKSLTVHSLEWLVFQPNQPKGPKGFHEHCRAALHYLRPAKYTPSLGKDFASVQKYYLETLQGCLPNLESVKWYMRIDEPKTATTLFLNFLVLLPSLKELDLSLKFNHISDWSVKHLLAQVSDLQKLTLRVHRGNYFFDQNDLQYFGWLIANNPNLTYLHLKLDHEFDSSKLFLGVFRHVPVDRLPKLKNLVLDTYIDDSELDIIPHLRSLQSLDLHMMPPSNFWETLAFNGIFILFLKVRFVNKALCEYLLLNPSLVSFAISDLWWRHSFQLGSLGLFRALETTNVAQIVISPPDWDMWFADAEIEACLRRCAKLRRITLNFAPNDIEDTWLPDLTTETVSRLGDKISLAISGNDDIHQAVRECCQSEDPLMKSLQQRLVFLEL